MGGDEPDMVRLYRLKLLRLISITRRSLVLAKLLLNVPDQLNESKREEVGRWLQTTIQDIDTQQEAEERAAAKEGEEKEAAEALVRPSDNSKAPHGAAVMGQGRAGRAQSAATASSSSSPDDPVRPSRPLPVPPVSDGATAKGAPQAPLGRSSGADAAKTKLPPAGTFGRSNSSRTLPTNDASVLKASPNKSFAVMLERAAFLPANALVEVVCRSEHMWIVKVPGIAKQCYHIQKEKLCAVQEAPSGIPWVLAEVEARVKHDGKGPELSFDVGQVILVLKITNHFWQGILPECGDVAIFDCTLVKLLRLTNPEMDNVARLLAAELASGGEGHPDEALRAALVMAMRRGSDEVTGMHVQVFNQCRAPDALPVCISNVRLSFSLDAAGARVEREVQLSAPESEHTQVVSSFGLWRGRVLPPNIGRSLMNRISFAFAPNDFELSADAPLVSLRISATLKPNVQLDEMQVLVLPVVLQSMKATLRYFLICEVVSTQLKRASMFRAKPGLDESWETMNVSQFEDSGMQDLLSDLVSLPEERAPTIAAPAPPSARVQALDALLK